MSVAALRKAARETLIARQGGRCAYCAEELDLRQISHGNLPSRRAATLDHIVPLSRGGTDADDNLVVACWRCNIAKGSLTAEEFVAGLNFDPALIATHVIRGWLAGAAEMPGASPRLRAHLPTMTRGIVRRAKHPAQHDRARALAGDLLADAARWSDAVRPAVLAGIVAGLFAEIRDHGLPAAVRGCIRSELGYAEGYRMGRHVVETRGHTLSPVT